MHPTQQNRDKGKNNEIFSLFFKGVLDLLFPKVCACCGKPLEELEHTICTFCRMDMPLTNFVFRNNNAMVELMAGRVDFERASALMFFRKHSSYQKLLHRMKYQGRDDIARVLGEIYGMMLLKSGLYGDVELILPVPLHWSKKLKRGYNQSEEFARGIAKSLKVKCEPRVLKRTRATKTQARLKGLEHRAKNVSEAFTVVNKYKGLINDKTVMLVDDIVTTGATLEACAEVINKATPLTTLHLGAIAIVAEN